METEIQWRLQLAASKNMTKQMHQVSLSEEINQWAFYVAIVLQDSIGSYTLGNHGGLTCLFVISVH
jgi:hypothetical protein